MKGPPKAGAIAVAAVSALFGCRAPDRDPRVALESYDPAQRARAVKGIAERGERVHIPALVDRLDDEDVAVRIAAIVALDALTGERLGYNAWAEPPERQAAITAWRAYVASNAESGWTARSN